MTNPADEAISIGIANSALLIALFDNCERQHAVLRTFRELALLQPQHDEVFASMLKMLESRAGPPTGI